MGTAISVRDVSFAYDAAPENTLENVSFDISYGEFVLLCGMSGEGKSTLLSIISGVIPNINHGKLSGSVFIDGKDVTALKISERARLVGSVLQNADEQIVYDCAKDEIAFGLENLNTPNEEITRRIAACCELMQVDKNAGTRNMSGGQKQRLITASTLAMGQRIIILDEPLANLDNRGAHILLSALRELSKSGYAVLLVEHRFDVIKPYIDKVMTIENKGVRLSEEISETVVKTLPPVQGRGIGEVLIRLKRLSFSAGKRTILDGIDFEVKKGERTVILGDNGCGKTTLLRTVSRLNKPSSGEFIQSIVRSRRACSEWFSKVGYVYQNPTYQLFMPTLLSEIAFRAKSPEKAQELIDSLGLSGLEKRHPQSLSEGQKRRAGIAAICAGEPEVLILDEPTVGQDFDNLKRIVDTVNKLNRETGCAVVTVTHDKRCIAALCDRAVIMSDGHIVKTGDLLAAYEYIQGRQK